MIGVFGLLKGRISTCRWPFKLAGLLGDVQVPLEIGLVQGMCVLVGVWMQQSIKCGSKPQCFVTSGES